MLEKKLGKEEVQQHGETTYQQCGSSNASCAVKRKWQGPNLPAYGWTLLQVACCLPWCFVQTGICRAKPNEGAR